MKILLEQSLRWCGKASLAGVALLAASCAKDSSAGAESGDQQIIALSEGEGALALDRKFAMQKGDVNYGESGEVTGGKRSQYEGMRQVQFGGEWQGKTYEKTEFGKKESWWGSKKAEVKAYAGGEDGSRFQQASAYGTQTAAADGQRSRFDGMKTPTGTYRTEAATEAGVTGVEKTSDPRTDWRREVYSPPPIMDHEEYEKRTIEETRSLLGRDD